MPPPSSVKMHGCHGSSTPRAHTLPAFSESCVSSLRGAEGALLELLPWAVDREAVDSSIEGSPVRKAQGLEGSESRLSISLPRWASITLFM